MKDCLNIGVPNWLTVIREKISEGDYEWILHTPGSPVILRKLGLSELEVPGQESLTLGCCGEKLVSLNGGGLYTELEAEPSLQQEFELKKLRPSLPPPDSCPGSTGTILLSPLGWPNLSPLHIQGENGPAGCMEAGGRMFSPLRMDPLIGYQPRARCREPSGSIRAQLSLGFFRVTTGFKRLWSVGEMIYGEAEDNTALFWKDGLLVLGDGEIEIEHPYYDVEVSLLCPLRVCRRRLIKGEVSGLAISIGGPLGSIAMGSSRPIKVRIEPGRIHVAFSRSLRAVRGGISAAVRLMHEDSVSLEVGEACLRGVGHARSHNVIAVYTGWHDGSMYFTAYSPISDGLFEFRSYLPLRRVTISDVLWGETEIPVAGDLVRAPLPYGSCASIEMVMGRGLFMRLRRSKGS